ncbi:hypothetical protein BofuT4_P081090.1 [Botrytis cinerea T4]|uniref:Uncharacterized protein n=1 Tax=Botryotinia fuckeliana (strain T4) TaxID=999810 RepID=G2YL16_BOTF4|nr:hypothetical protein BofuT4_P081090.1 [Botrytis cinerea T4]
MEDLPAATVDASTQTTPVKPVSKQTLWGWLRRTEIKSNALDLLARLLFLIFLVGLGTFFLIEYSTAAEATAKANRLALFTARVSFPDQPKIYTLNFCEKSSDTGLDEFAKCDKASVSPPVLWNMDVLAEALQIIQPAWQFEAVCGMEMVLYPPDLTLVLSIPISTSENCHLDCLEPIPVSTSKKPGLKLCFTRLIVCIWSIISPIFLRGTFHWRSYQTITSSIVYRFFSLGSKQPACVKIIGRILSVSTALNRGPLNTNTVLLLVTHFIGLELQCFIC